VHLEAIMDGPCALWWGMLQLK